MNKKVLFSLAAALCVGVSALALSACNDNHEHTYDTKLTPCGADGHWYAATCGHDVDGKGLEGHNYGDWNIVTPATEAGTGLRKRTCKDCGYVDNDVIAKLEHTHTYADVFTSCGADGHWYAANCGHNVDGKDFEEHKYGSWVVDREESLTQTGLRHRTCGDCGYVEEEVIPKHVHALTEEWKTSSIKHWKETTCPDHPGLKVDEDDHDWEIEDEPATETESGHYKKYCKICEYVSEDRVIDPLGAGSSISPFTAVEGKNEGATTENSETASLDGSNMDYVQYWTYTATAAGTVTLSVDADSDCWLYKSSESMDDVVNDEEYLEWIASKPQFASFEYEVQAGDVIYMIAVCNNSDYLGAYNFYLTFTAA